MRNTTVIMHTIGTPSLSRVLRVDCYVIDNAFRTCTFPKNRHKHAIEHEFAIDEVPGWGKEFGCCGASPPWYHVCMLAMGVVLLGLAATDRGACGRAHAAGPPGRTPSIRSERTRVWSTQGSPRSCSGAVTARAPSQDGGSARRSKLAKRRQTWSRWRAS